MATKRVVFFYLDRYVYGLDVEATKGIEKMLDFIPVPSSLPHIKGLLNLRGEVIPVYSLRTKLGLLPKQPDSETQLIIGGLKNGVMLAMEVDRMREIIEVDDKEFTAVPALIQNQNTGYISKVVHLKDTLAIMIDLEGMLTEEEKRNIQKFIEDSKKQEEAVEEASEEEE
ncbi:chemotaxis protein CheW [Acetivibrio ethanolgignens]|uniref:CheW-like domain-containing protein n=1 Tax=Acetivibrio ethanolgignens TaxID=290052 RepID=A0A0V8QJA1_9FIRM|nr:chemotaxis protein CheW [Acetivibrio ethanolgignens]KSV60625.1 hypothetical protein ASU35_00160 [Acetivibrio ethanolgignens]